MKRRNQAAFALATLISAGTLGCSSDEDDGSSSASDAPTEYAFESRFQEGESSVAYSGQTMRHLLIADLSARIAGLPETIESDADFDASQVEATLLSYYEFDSDTQGGQEILLSTDPASLQQVYDDVSTGKDLAGKIAGQDSGGEKDHEDWSTEFRGWSDDSIAEHGGAIDTPNGLVRAFIATIAHNAELQVNGDGSREGLLTYQTAQGVDLHQLVQKFLLGAVAFSQGVDDYLDEGLTADNQESDEGAPYTALEHQWDEGFGYFGASRFFNTQSDEAIADGESVDADDDGAIDFTSEYNFGASVNTAKRDLGSTTGTDFSGQAMDAFLKGRQLISSGGSAEEIEEQATIAAVAWEKALAATAVHYINDTLADQASLGTEDYSFDDHAKHWSELKGFALSLQFNPRSPLAKEDFVSLHELIGDHPLLEDASEDELADYETALLEARELLQGAYEFAQEDVENW